MQEDGNIMDFYVNGDVAPGGRFNYHYFTEITTGIPINGTPSFLIYPNPAKEVVNITFPLATKNNSRVTIYSITGQILWQKKYRDSILSDCINIDFIKNKGTYIIELCDREKSETGKLIIN